MGVVTLDTLHILRDEWRQRGQRVVLTNGVFDLLHVGHAGYLAEARALGDLLVVALNSDASVRTIKGPQRPIVAEDSRAALLAALRCVDYVTLFAQPTAEAVVRALQPDIYVKGGDYAADSSTLPDLTRLPEAKIVLEYGGKVRLLPYAPGNSSSALIQRIVDLYSESGVS